jgi:hypothetical protein
MTEGESQDGGPEGSVLFLLADALGLDAVSPHRLDRLCQLCWLNTLIRREK